MKLKYIYSFIASMVMFFSACSPDDFNLGGVDVKSDELVEGIAFSITPDPQNPNIIYLENKLSSKYQVVWEHPQGRSLENKVTLKIPFAGEYEVKFGVQTRGGYLFGDAAKFTVADMCAEFISDPMWTLVAGGAGQSKTWILDLDADGLSRHFLGPIYFFTADYHWDNLHNAAGGNYLDSDPWDATSAIVPNLADGTAATWYWLADWVGNSWMCNKADFGAMTFDLIGGANVTTDQAAYGLTKETGTYMLDTEKHTIKFSGAWPMHDKEHDGEMKEKAPGRVFNILYLSENFMQIMVPASGTCYNYISKEYKDNWAPPVDDNAAPELPDGWEDEVGQITNNKIVWKLSTDTPFDWCNLYGVRKNSFKAITDYPDWFTPAEKVAEITLTLDSKKKSYKLELPDFTSVNGTYQLSAEGIYTFDKGLSSYLVGGDWVYFGADSDKELRVMSYELNTSGIVSDLWLGAKQIDNNGKHYQYLAYHFVAQLEVTQEVSYPASMSCFNSDTWANTLISPEVGVTKDGSYTVSIDGSSSATNFNGCYVDILNILKDHPNATFIMTSVKVDGNNVPFDNSLISYTAGDVATTSRIYVRNPWGDVATAAFPDPAVLAFNSSISITFTVAFNDGAE